LPLLKLMTIENENNDSPASKHLLNTQYSILNTFCSNLAFIGAILICIGFVIAEKTPAPQSIGVVMIFLQPFFKRDIKTAIRNLFFNKYAAGLCIYYLLILVSAINTSNWHEYNKLILMQLPLVMIPFGLYKNNLFTNKQRNIIFAALVVSIIIAGIASFINYILHFDAIQESIIHSKPIPIITGVNHIYYSILLAFSAVILQWWLFFKHIINKLFLAIAWISLIIIIILLHTISARTGLFCFYGEVAASVLWLVIKRKKIVLGVSIALGMCLLALFTVKMVPSEKNRLDNTKVDLNKYSSGQDINHYSLSMRLAALKTGAEVFKKNPVFGVGPAGVQDAMYAEYKLENSRLILENQKKPHNQFLYSLVSMGIIGGLVLCFIMFMPFFTGAVFDNYPLLAFMIVCLIAFQFEYMLERQVGITSFCLFYIILSHVPGYLSSTANAIQKGEQ